MASAHVMAHELAVANGEYRAAFANYERRLKPFVDAKQRSAEHFGGWFAPRTAIGLELRNIVTHLLNIPWFGDRIVGRSLSDKFEPSA